MSSIQYVVNIWIGHLIHAAVIIGFLANINVCYAYFKSAKSDSTSFMQYARYAFLIQSVMVKWGTGFDVLCHVSPIIMNMSM